MKEQLSSSYFEQQSLFSLECGRCALNNFLGTKAFTSKELHQICQELSADFINPYKSILGGDYDISVLIIALQKKGYSINWVKSDVKITEIRDSQNFCGFLLNVQNKRRFWHKIFDLSGRHWTCIKPKSKEQYLYFDSEKQFPETWSFKYTTKYLESFLKQRKGTLLQIIKQTQNQNK